MTDKPWFIRVRRPIGFKLLPYSPAGWIATALYVAGVIAMGAIHARWAVSRAGWIAWAIVFAAWTIAYLTIAFRNSEAGEVQLTRDVRARQKK